MNIYLTFFIFYILLATVSCSNILGVFAMPSYSHYTLGHVLLEELAIKGHNVTMISPYKQNKKIQNYNEIVLEGIQSIQKGKHIKRFSDLRKMYPINQIISSYKIGAQFTDFTLSNKNVQNLLKSNQTFDVVILENFYNEAMLGISYELKAPTIIFSTLGSSAWNNHMVANPASLSFVPSIFLNHAGNLNFYERYNNLFIHVADELYKRFVAFPNQDKILHKAFPNAPALNDLIYKRDLFVLLNSHVSVCDPVPHVPNMVEIAGFHPKPQKLPKDLQKLLDSTTQGVIFFSLGSNVNVTFFSESQLKNTFKAIKKLHQIVSWKSDAENLPDKPDNVILNQWYPQQAILAHPNTKAFISHCGLLSVIETVHYKVPIICIPIFADQFMNAHLAVNRGFAIELDIDDLREEKLSAALYQILNNKTYQENVELRSALMKDRLVHPLNEAVYWVEYVIRQKGASNFHSKAMNLEWYQYEMLDVAGLLFIFALAILFIIGYIVKSLIQNLLLPTIITRVNLTKKKN